MNYRIRGKCWFYKKMYPYLTADNKIKLKLVYRVSIFTQ